MCHQITPLTRAQPRTRTRTHTPTVICNTYHTLHTSQRYSQDKNYNCSHVEAAKTKTDQQNDTGGKEGFHQYYKLYSSSNIRKQSCIKGCFKLFVVLRWWFSVSMLFFLSVFFLLVFTRIRMCFYWEKKKSINLSY